MRVVGVEIGATHLTAAIASDGETPRVVVTLPATEHGQRGWKWSLDHDATSQRLAASRLSALYAALLPYGVAGAALTAVSLSEGYGDHRAALLVDAVSAAGFPSIRVVGEAVATALGVGLTWQKSHALLIDLGAAHCSASVIEIDPGGARVVATEGVEASSLDEVARSIRDELIAKLERASGAALAPSAPALLLDEVRQALATWDEGALTIHSVAPGEAAPWALVVPDEAMRFLMDRLVDGVCDLAMRVLVSSRVGPGTIQRGWMSGGASRNGPLRAALGMRLGVGLRSAPSELTAAGAARFAQELLGFSLTPPPPEAASEAPPSTVAEIVEVTRSGDVSPSRAPPPDDSIDRANVSSEVRNLRVTGPPSSAHALPRAGRFRGARSPVELLGMPLMRMPTEDELARPYLPVILLQLASAHATGALTLRRGGESARLLMSAGGVCVPSMDRARAQRVLDWSEGEFSWRDEAPPPAVAKSRAPTFGFVASGLRIALRGMADDAVLAAFGPRLALSPVVIPERRRRVTAMELGPAEQRAVDHMLDGTRDVHALLGEGYIGRLSFMRVLLLLDAFGALRWTTPAEDRAELPIDRLKRRLARMEHEDHFTALGLHWTATHEDVGEAWDQFQRECAPDGRWGSVDRSVAARILDRGRRAWDELRDSKRRIAYRHALHPDVDETLLATVVAAQAELLAFRGETKVASAMRGLAVEMASGAPPSNLKPK